MGDWEERTEDKWRLGTTYALEVRSNPLGALQFKLPWLFGRQKSIKVVTIGYIDDELGFVPGAGAVAEYQTCSDFLWSWEIDYTEPTMVPVPFLREAIGFGDLFERFAERFPLWFKMLFSGCCDRKEWFNHSLVFIPWRAL